MQYEKTIQTAFTEVSDCLIAHQRVRESREKQEALVAALQDRLRLAYVRYRGGVDTQLNALDADRDLFQAELDSGPDPAPGTADRGAALQGAGRRMAINTWRLWASARFRADDTTRSSAPRDS